MYDVVVIGGGISGLTAAYSLTRDASKKILLLEAGSRIGGKIQTERLQGLQMECGPNTFPATANNILKLCLELGLLPAQASVSARNRYILYRKQLRKVPLSPPEILTTNLLGPIAKLRLLLEPFQPQVECADESVSSFTRRRLGQQVLDNLLGPFLSGIYAGDPDVLSARAVFPKLVETEKKYGSLLKGLMNQSNRTVAAQTEHRLLSFAPGIASLVEALCLQLPAGSVRLDALVRRIAEQESGYAITLSGGERILSRCVILATPADVAGQLLEPLIPNEAGYLKEIPYAPLCVAHLAYAKADIPAMLDGFGFLVAKPDRRRLLGSVWISSLFPERAPVDRHLLSCYVSGRMACQSNEEILEDLNHEFRKIFRTSLIKPLQYKIIRHRRAIPQYQVGHPDKIKVVEAACFGRPGVYLAGNYLRGVSLDSCVESGMRAAHSANEFLTLTPL